MPAGDENNAGSAGRPRALERAGLAEQVEELRADLQAKREHLGRVPTGDERHTAAVEVVLEATEALIVCEARVPARLAAHAHHRRAWLVYPVVAVAGLVGVVFGVLAVTGARSRWWLILLVLFLLAVGGVAEAHREQTAGRTRAVAAPILLAVVTVVVVLLLTGVISAWWSILAVPGFLGAVGVAGLGEIQP